ncbi:FMN-binding negative transcriptional regulator [Roseomonas sp. GCM10028921]
MYVPPAFREEDPAVLHGTIRDVRLANVVAVTDQGLVATPLPLFQVPNEGPFGTLYGHLARANPQGRLPPLGDAVALFMGPDAYVSPAWYPSKQEHGKVVPTWTYVAVHAYGPAEFFDDADRLLEVVTQLTNLHEETRTEPWAVAEAPRASSGCSSGGS